jgi:hypothetical protein
MTPDGLLIHKQPGVGLVVSAAEHNFKLSEWDSKLERLQMDLLHESDDRRREKDKLLESLESMARQHCDTRKCTRDYNGQVAGTLVTDSGAISANGEALETLAAHGKFHIVAGLGRMVVGYWPENLPAALDLSPGSALWARRI